MARPVGLTDETASELVDALRDARTEYRSWKAARLAPDRLARAQQETGEDDTATQLLRSFEVTIVPGPLQTADHARSVLTAITGLSRRDVEQAVTARVRRQELLYDSAHQFRFLLCEAALYITAASAAVMRAQLDRLAVVAGLANVEVRVLPARSELSAGLMNAFTVRDDRVVVIETTAGEFRFTKPATSRRTPGCSTIDGRSPPLAMTRLRSSDARSGCSPGRMTGD